MSVHGQGEGRHQGGVPREDAHFQRAFGADQAQQHRHNIAQIRSHRRPIAAPRSPVSALQDPVVGR